jgi:hypothetical protein
MRELIDRALTVSRRLVEAFCEGGKDERRKSQKVIPSECDLGSWIAKRGYIARRGPDAASESKREFPHFAEPRGGRPKVNLPHIM